MIKKTRTLTLTKTNYITLPSKSVQFNTSLVAWNGQSSETAAVDANGRKTHTQSQAPLLTHWVDWGVVATFSFQKHSWLIRAFHKSEIFSQIQGWWCFPSCFCLEQVFNIKISPSLFVFYYKFFMSALSFYLTWCSATDQAGKEGGLDGIRGVWVQISYRYPYFIDIHILQNCRLIDVSYRYIEHPEMEWMLDGWMGIW